MVIIHQQQQGIVSPALLPSRSAHPLPFPPSVSPHFLGKLATPPPCPLHPQIMDVICAVAPGMPSGPPRWPSLPLSLPISLPHSPSPTLSSLTYPLPLTPTGRGCCSSCGARHRRTLWTPPVPMWLFWGMASPGPPSCRCARVGTCKKERKNSARREGTDKQENLPPHPTVWALETFTTQLLQLKYHTSNMAKVWGYLALVWIHVHV